jgi:hypothetical protein
VFVLQVLPAIPQYLAGVLDFNMADRPVRLVIDDVQIDPVRYLSMPTTPVVGLSA